MSTTEKVRVHPFEAAGHGMAPFKFRYIEEIVFVDTQGYSHAGGSCDYCGTLIRWAYWLRSACGKDFKVGCDCVAKTHMPGDTLLSVVAREEKNRKKAADKARKELRIARLYKELDDPEMVEVLQGLPHPHRPDSIDHSLHSYITNKLRVAGMAGKIECCRMVEPYMLPDE
jgi:hypothetical protein